MRFINIFFLLILGSSIHAQPLSKGTIFVNSTTHSLLFSKNYSRINDSTWNATTKNFQIHINPKVGYFLIQKLAAGLSIDYQLERTLSETWTLTEKEIKSGIFFRYIFNEKSLSPFLNADMGLLRNTLIGKSNSLTTTIVNKGSYYKMGLGLHYFIFEKVSIEFSWNYQLSYLKQMESTVNLNTKSLNHIFLIGGSYFFNRLNN